MKNRALVGLFLVAILAAALWYVGSDSSTKPAAARATPASERATPLPDKDVRTVSRQKAIPTSAREEAPLPELVTRVREEIRAEHAEWIPTLDKVLSTSDSEREDAVRELGFTEEPRFLRPIIRMLQSDTDEDVRSAAAASLVLYDSAPEATFALVEALRDRDEEVRKDALLSLAAHRNSLTQSELRRNLEGGGLDEQTAEAVKLFLDHYYVRKDPFRDPLGE